MITHKYDDFFIGESPPEGYYIYGWICEDWGGVYYYIGKGTGNRYRSTHNRGKAFLKILECWTCFPAILKQNLTYERACIEEDKYKQMFLFELGCPIMDGEGHNSSLKNIATRHSKEILRAQGKKTDGRYKKRPADFERYYTLQQRGEISVAMACEKLGICRHTWYERAKEIDNQSNLCYNSFEKE